MKFCEMRFVGRMKCILSELFVVGFKPLGDTDDNF